MVCCTDCKVWSARQEANYCDQVSFCFFNYPRKILFSPPPPPPPKGLLRTCRDSSLHTMEKCTINTGWKGCGITCGNETRKPIKISHITECRPRLYVTLQSGHIITGAIIVDCFKLSLGTAEHYWVPQHTIGYHRTLLGTAEHYWVPQNTIGYRRTPFCDNFFFNSTKKCQRIYKLYP